MKGNEMRAGIIGMGHLGKAVLAGFLRSGMNPEQMMVSARTEKTLQMVQDSFPGVAVTTDNKELVLKTDIVIVVLRPQDAREVLGELKDLSFSDKTIVSLMAGVRIRAIREMLQDIHGKYHIVRMMPNVAVSLCKGVIGVSSEEDKGQLGNVLSMFEKLGYLVYLPEDDLEKVTICAASGLGFAAFIMKRYMDSCNRFFMDETVSGEITKRVFETAVDIIRNDDSSFEKLVEQISTKGGTTEAGINVLKQRDLGNIFDDCMDEAISRVKN